MKEGCVDEILSRHCRRAMDPHGPRTQLWPDKTSDESIIWPESLSHWPQAVLIAGPWECGLESRVISVPVISVSVYLTNEAQFRRISALSWILISFITVTFVHLAEAFIQSSIRLPCDSELWFHTQILTRLNVRFTWLSGNLGCTEMIVFWCLRSWSEAQTQRGHQDVPRMARPKPVPAGHDQQHPERSRRPLWDLQYYHETQTQREQLQGQAIPHKTLKQETWKIK